MGWSHLVFFEGKFQSGVYPQLRIDFNLPLVQLDDPFDNRQTDPRTFHHVAGLKGLKNLKNLTVFLCISQFVSFNLT